MLLADVAGAAEAGLVVATICTIASVAGGVLGYAIGALLYDSLGALADHALRGFPTRSTPSAPPMPNGAR